MLANLIMVTRPEDEIADRNAAREYVGMPEYDDEQAHYKLVINFEDEDVRQEFIKQIEAKHVTKRNTAWTMWWPDRPRDDSSSVIFTNEELKTDGVIND